MRSLVVLLCLGAVLAGCSFAKDPKGKESVSNLSNPIEDSVTAFDKLIVGIRTNDSKLFEEGLNKASLEDLNTLSFSGQSLIELCIQYGRFEFFEKLTAAGASIFRFSMYSAEGMRTLVIEDRKFKLAYLAVKDREMSLAFAECVKDSPLEFAEYLKKRWLSPLYPICGRDRNFFDYYFAENMRAQHDRALAVLDAYLNNSLFAKDEIVSAAMVVALRFKNESIFDVLDAHCLVNECVGHYESLLRFIGRGRLKDVLEGYELLVNRYSARPPEKGFPKYIVNRYSIVNPVPPGLRPRFNPDEDTEAVPGIGVVVTDSKGSDRTVFSDSIYLDAAIDRVLLERRAVIVDDDELKYFDERAKELGLEVLEKKSSVSPSGAVSPP